MKKRIPAILLALTLLLTSAMSVLAEVNFDGEKWEKFCSEEDEIQLASEDLAELSSSPASVNQTRAIERINSLILALNGKYFTTTEKACYSAVADECYNVNVVACSWLKNAIGIANIDWNNFPVYWAADSGRITKNAWSCAGFASFAQWYIFSYGSGDYLGEDTKVIQNATWNYNNVLLYCKPGDIIRLGSSSNSDQHSAIFISSNSSGVYVLDNNYNNDNRIGTRTYSYSQWKNFSVSRAFNYDVSEQDTYKVLFNANGGNLDSAHKAYHEINGVNVDRATEYLVIYTQSHETNIYGYDVLLDTNGKVNNILYGVANGTNQMIAGGMNVSGTGSTRTWIDNNISLGDYIYYSANDQTIYVYATENQFLSNGKKVTKGSTYGTLPTPTRTGYTFDGWYTAANGGTQITSTTTVNLTDDQTLYAHWESATPFVIDVVRIMSADHTMSWSAPPDEDMFYGEATVENLSYDGIATIVLVCYDYDGRLRETRYLYGSLSIGQEFTFGASFSNKDRKAAKIKAFVWSNLTDLTPLAEGVSLGD